MKYYRDEDFIKRFGERLKHVRTSKKLSLEELANETGFEISLEIRGSVTTKFRMGLATTTIDIQLF